MRCGLTLLVLVLALAAAPALAAGKGKVPAVGPNDGKAVESLPAVDTPLITVAEKMPDFTFPESLEKMGDARSALIAWHKLAHEFSGADRARARLAAARLQLKLEEFDAAAGTLTTFLNENPTSPRADEAAYLLTFAAQPGELPAMISAIAAKPARSAWDDAALYAYVWKNALKTGKVPETYGLEKAETLKQRLSMLNQKAMAAATTAMAMSVVPGAGHLFVQKNASGGMLLTIWALLGLAFLSACRHRHYAYAFVFAFPFAALWLSAPASVMEIMEERARADRQLQMASWEDLRPQEPQPGTPAAATPQAAPSGGEDLPALTPTGAAQQNLKKEEPEHQEETRRSVPLQSLLPAASSPATANAPSGSR